MKVGKHDIQLAEIAAVTPNFWRTGYWIYLKGSGVGLYISNAEKEAFDAECEIQDTVRKMYDVARGAGLKAFA